MNKQQFCLMQKYGYIPYEEHTASHVLSHTELVVN